MHACICLTCPGWQCGQQFDLRADTNREVPQLLSLIGWLGGWMKASGEAPSSVFLRLALLLVVAPAALLVLLTWRAGVLGCKNGR